MYFAKHGFSDNQTRMEILLANIAHMISVGAGIKNPKTGSAFGADHFLPWLREEDPEEERFATKEEIMAMFPIRKPH